MSQIKLQTISEDYAVVGTLDDKKEELHLRCNHAWFVPGNAKSYDIKFSHVDKRYSLNDYIYEVRYFTANEGEFKI
jgi:hypothetical protein